MKIDNSIIINKALKEVWEFAMNTDNLVKWIKKLKSFESISGSPRTVGGISKHVYEEANGKEIEMTEKVEKLKLIEKNLEKKGEDIATKLGEVAKLSQEDAYKQLLETVEEQHGKDLTDRMRKLEAEGEDRFQGRAKEIVAYAIQKTAVSQTQEITSTTVMLPSEDIKGKIIGKEGRNIRALEQAIGVNLIIDDTPGVITISSFDGVRREIAQKVLQTLIKDGRIQPTRIEEVTLKVKEEIEETIKKAGEINLKFRAAVS